MVPVSTALVVGGGIGGMSVALELRRLGIEVDLIDLDPNWRVYGAGITITGPTLRAFRQLGVFDAIAAQAYTGEGIRICDMAGRELSVLPTPTPVGDPIPSSGGIMRPVLHAILSERVRASGTHVRLGLSLQSLQLHPGAVSAQLTDGTQGRYDLLVGADGLFSGVRSLLFDDAPPPRYTGQCIWRAVLARPPQIDRRHFFLGGPCKVGLSPVSAEEMYLFVLERSEQKRYVAEEQLPAQLQQLLRPYGGIIGEIREGLDQTSRIVLRPLEAFLLPPPWHRGRAVLIGDAAHPTTPQLASGAGMAVEDALVLAQELLRANTAEQALQGFMQRRFERCQLVVRNSLEIGRREQAGASVAEQTELVEQSLAALAAPI